MRALSVVLIAHFEFHRGQRFELGPLQPRPELGKADAEGNSLCICVGRAHRLAVGFAPLEHFGQAFRRYVRIDETVNCALAPVGFDALPKAGLGRGFAGVWIGNVESNLRQ